MRIATTAEHLRHPDLILLVDDDEDMSALSRVWWRIIDRNGYATTSVGLAILDKLLPRATNGGRSNTPDS